MRVEIIESGLSPTLVLSFHQLTQGIYKVVTPSMWSHLRIVVVDNNREDLIMINVRDGIVKTVKSGHDWSWHTFVKLEEKLTLVFNKEGE